jgi:hypothetical protein
MPNSRLKTVSLVVASLAAGVALGWLLAHFTPGQPKERAAVSQKHPDLLAAYNLLTTTLEDESKLDRLGLFKTITFDRPPETIRKIIAQVSDASDNTLKQLDHYRALSPVIHRLQKTDGFGDNLQDAMKKEMTSSLMERSPSFSKRLLLSQAQALGMLVVLTKEIEKMDPNKDRQVWIRRVSADFGKMYDAYLQHLRFVPSE